MPLSAKERMQRYRNRIKEDPERHAEYLYKESERWKKRREERKLPKLIEEMNEREARKQRKNWKKETKARRERKQQRDDLMRNATVFASPPNSPTNAADGEVEHPAPVTEKAKRGRRIVKKDRAKAYKKIKKLEEELQKKTREADKFRK